MGKRKKRKNGAPRNEPSASAAALSKRGLLKEAGFWTAVLFFLSLGFPIIFPDAGSAATLYLGWAFWGLTLTLFVAALYQHRVLPPWIMAFCSLAAIAVFSWIAHKNISDRLRPSFVYVVPGVVLNGDTWDFIANHRGPKSSEGVQVLLVDKDRANYLRSTSREFSVADLNSYQVIWNLSEVNPMGRGSIFAKQLVWKPFSLADSHFSVDITWRDGNVHEEIEIARVQDKWKYAMTVTDPDTSRTLLACQDDGFTSVKALPHCFPAFTQPGI